MPQTRLLCLRLRWAGSVCAVAAAVLAGAGGAAAAHPPDTPGKKPRDCLDAYREVPGQGPSCPVAARAWKVKLRDGTTVETHGPDYAADVVVPAPLIPRQPTCAAENPHGSYRSVAIVAWPPGVTPNETDASLRARLRDLNGRLYADAIESGSPDGADYVFACDELGEIRVDRVALSTPAASASFSSIVSDLMARGYASPNEKYVVWYDDRRGNMPCGVGTLAPDERDAAFNLNNIGPDWGVSFDCNALMHEHGHNVGAVQYASPFSTGDGGHCWQERDIMCYADGGNRYPGWLSLFCTDRDHFDCGFDDYFDAAIAEGQGSGLGSYLDRSWNIGECYVRWIVNYACSDVTPFPGYYKAGTSTCGPSNPEWVTRSPLVYGFSPSQFTYVLWQRIHARWDGAVWHPAPPAPRFVSSATSSVPARQWWNLETDAYAGSAPELERGFHITSPGSWAAMDRLTWYTQAGEIIHSAWALERPGGVNAEPDSYFCTWP